MKGALLVVGTASDAGKSLVVTGLCRHLARQGVKVAPFKAQNMSLNSFATASGHEIGRAQALQAWAARVEPEVEMNPILLKPTSERRSQVVVLGEPVGETDARSYLENRRQRLLPTVLDAFGALRSRYDVVICEGAGSPAEINLLEGDVVNLGLAEAAGVSALLVGDIDRGGVFASLAGTFAVLPEHLARHIKAFAINKFRGDPSLLSPGISALEEMVARPCAGVIPYLDGLELDAEDSLGLAALVRAASRGSAGALDVAVVAFPHVANFTDLDPLALEPGVSLRLVDDASHIGDPDLVFLPGSKATVADLAWLTRAGLADVVIEMAARPGGPTILGVCAGYQMLGVAIEDEHESKSGHTQALGLLPVVTTFQAKKRTLPRAGLSLGSRVTGYEIRQGEPVVSDGAGGVEPFAWLDDRFGEGPEGCLVGGGRVAGTSLHGLFESDEFRERYLSEVAGRRGKDFVAGGVRHAERREAQIDRLADALEEYLDLDLVTSLVSR